MRLVSISSRSPHYICDGTTLRVKNLLECAAQNLGFEVHAIAPVGTSERAEAQRWSGETGIRLHAMDGINVSEWNTDQRALFTSQATKTMAGIQANKYIDSTIVMVHGLQPIIDMAAVAGAGWVADLIDETGPRMLYMVRRYMLQGKMIQAMQACNNYRQYRIRMIPCVSRYGQTIVAAHEDGRRLVRLVPGIRIAVIPNGVSLPLQERLVPWALRDKFAMFHGVFSYEPNEDAALFLINRIAPAMMEHLDGWRMLVAGRSPTRRMHAKAAKQPIVELLADAPDLGGKLAMASLGVYPVFMRTGIQNKVLEALSYGVPVITTPGVRAVLKEFNARVESCVRCAATLKEFIDIMHSLVEHPADTEAMGLAGREYVATAFDWCAVAKKLFFKVNENNAV